MYLKKRPWYYRKGDEFRQANFTNEVRDLVALGYIRVDANGNPFEVSSNPVEPKAKEEPKTEPKVDLKSLTRAELLDLAEKSNVELKGYASKAEIIKAIEGK